MLGRRVMQMSKPRFACFPLYFLMSEFIWCYSSIHPSIHLCFCLLSVSPPSYLLNPVKMSLTVRAHPPPSSQLDIWNHPRRINWWLLHPLICHNYFISDWSDCAIADGVRADAPFPPLIKGSHFNWSLFNANCSLCCKSVSVSLPRSLLANCLGSFLVSSWIEFYCVA